MTHPGTSWVLVKERERWPPRRVGPARGPAVDLDWLVPRAVTSRHCRGQSPALGRAETVAPMSASEQVPRIHRHTGIVGSDPLVAAGRSTRSGALSPAVSPTCRFKSVPVASTASAQRAETCGLPNVTLLRSPLAWQADVAVHNWKAYGPLRPGCCSDQGSCSPDPAALTPALREYYTRVVDIEHTRPSWNQNCTREDLSAPSSRSRGFRREITTL